MNNKVNHRYPKKNLKNLRRADEADCTKCAFAEKSATEANTWYCNAALYDIETLSCFVPRKDDQKGALPWYMSIFNPKIFEEDEENGTCRGDQES